MFKRTIGLMIATLFLVIQVAVGQSHAAELDRETRTVPLNDQGDTIVLSLKQVTEGRRLFSSNCASCHMMGITKTDPNVGLDPEALSLATPSRNSVEALVDFMKNPTTYDGATEISELHPSTKSADIFPVMRNLTDDQLVEIAGHILLQPKVAGERWGGSKAVR
jgi:photosystem II cytochrome c550